MSRISGLRTVPQCCGSAHASKWQQILGLLCALLALTLALPSAAQEWRTQLFELAARDLPIKTEDLRLERCPEALGIESYSEPSAPGWQPDGWRTQSMGGFMYSWTRYKSDSGTICVRLNLPKRELLTAEDARALLRAGVAHQYLQAHREPGPPVPVPVGPVRWTRVSLERDDPPTFSFMADRDLAPLAITELEDLLSSEPPLSWHCDLGQYSVDCKVIGPTPFAAQINYRLDHDRVRGADGAPASALEGSIVTARPSLMAELLSSDDREQPQIELLAPMDLTLASIRSSVALSVDGMETAYTLAPSRPTRIRERTWRYNANPDGSEPRTRIWGAEPRFAWRVDLPPMRAGQRLALRLRAGLRTPSGPLSNHSEDPQGDLLLTWELPSRATLRTTCGDERALSYSTAALLSTHLSELPEATRCHPEQRLLLYFDTRPTAQTLAALGKALPAPLRLDPAGLQALHTDPAYRRQQIPLPASTAYRVGVLGAEAAQHYRLKIDPGWRDIYGAAITPGELIWSTAGPPSTTFAPNRMTFRRSPAAAGPSSRQQDPGPILQVLTSDGSRSEHQLAWPYRSTITPARLGLPAGSAFWASGEQISRSIDRSWMAPLAIAVTDFGLHALLLGDQLLAVVTDLDSGGPVPGTEVILRSADGVLAQTQTDADGLARFSLSPDHAGQTLLLVAARGDQEAVLGITENQALNLRWALQPNASPTESQLLYTDKQSYEPDEPVRLWSLLASKTEAGWQWSGDLPEWYPQDDPMVGIGAYDELSESGSVLSAISPDPDSGVSEELPAPGGPGTQAFSLFFLGESIVLPRSSVLPWSIEPVLTQPALVAGDSIPVAVSARDSAGEPLANRLASLTAGMAHRWPWAQRADRLSSHFPDYRFVDPWRHSDSEERECTFSSSSVDLPPTGANGERTAQLRLPQLPCEFAEIVFSAWPSAGFTLHPGPQARRLLARQPRYLGLAGLDRPIVTVGSRLRFGVTAVEIASLTQRDGVSVRLTVVSDDPDFKLFHCQLRSGDRSACRWRARRAGSYRISLQADDYPDADFSLRVGPDVDHPPGRAPAHLAVVDPEAFRPSALALTQPYDTGRVLLVLNDSDWRGAQWFQLSAGIQHLPVQLPPGYGGCLHALALVFPASPPGVPVEPIDHARTQLCVDPPSADLVAMDAQREGALVRLRLRSRHDLPVTLALSVFEDLSAAHGPTRLASGELTHCFHEDRRQHAQSPILHSLQGAEVWRDRAQSPGRAEGVPDLTMPWPQLRCRAEQRRLIPPAGPTHLVIPTRQRNLLWRPGMRLAPREVREFEVAVPADGADWLVELLAVDEALQVQTESRQLPRRD